MSFAVLIRNWLCAVVVLGCVAACGRSTPSPGPAAPTVRGGLHSVTWVTATPDAVKDFLAAFGLEAVALPASPAGAARAESALLGVPEEVAAGALLFANKSDLSAPRVRVITVPAGGPAVRDAHSARRDGGASLGFACTPQGLAGALQPATQLDVTVPRPDGGGEYTVRELYFHAPDGVLVACVVRPADVAPIAPVNAAVGAGGPAYAGITVADVEREVAFYAAVLGLEKRRDFALTDPKLLAAAGLPADARVRFVQLFAPGTTTGNLTLIDLGDQGERNANMRPPARGLSVVTFRVTDVLEVRRRLKAALGVVVSGPLATTSSYFGTYKSMTALAPSGTMVEFIEAAAE